MNKEDTAESILMQQAIALENKNSVQQAVGLSNLLTSVPCPKWKNLKKN
jgi:hypothetical protein